jgi:hypothetical protein
MEGVYTCAKGVGLPIRKSALFNEVKVLTTRVGIAITLIYVNSEPLLMLIHILREVSSLLKIRHMTPTPSVNPNPNPNPSHKTQTSPSHLINLVSHPNNRSTKLKTQTPFQTHINPRSPTPRPPATSPKSIQTVHPAIRPANLAK